VGSRYGGRVNQRFCKSEVAVTVITMTFVLAVPAGGLCDVLSHGVQTARLERDRVISDQSIVLASSRTEDPATQPIYLEHVRDLTQDQRAERARFYIVIAGDGRVHERLLGPVADETDISLQPLEDGRPCALYPYARDAIEDERLEVIALDRTDIGRRLLRELKYGEPDTLRIGPREVVVPQRRAGTARWNVSPQGTVGFIATPDAGHLLSLSFGGVSGELLLLPSSDQTGPSAAYQNSMFSRSNKHVVDTILENANQASP